MEQTSWREKIRFFRTSTSIQGSFCETARIARTLVMAGKYRCRGPVSRSLLNEELPNSYTWSGGGEPQIRATFRPFYLLPEVGTCKTWRQGKEMRETQQGHMMVESGKFTHKHGVAMLLNRRWKSQINCVQCASERVPDHQVEKTYKTITTTIEKDKSMKIIGGDLNVELGP